MAFHSRASTPWLTLVIGGFTSAKAPFTDDPRLAAAGDQVENRNAALFARRSATRALQPQSDIEIAHEFRVRLDEQAPRLDFVAHQRPEHFVGEDGVVDVHAEQRP